MLGQVTLHVEAPAERLWALVSDITNMGQWSPETYVAEWVDGSNGPEVGARFKGRNRRFGFVKYGTVCTVVAADPGREFAFVVGKPEKYTMKWSYRFEPSGTGTDVTESWESNMPGAATQAALPKKRQQNLALGMQRTLERIKAAAEAPEAAG